MSLPTFPSIPSTTPNLGSSVTVDVVVDVEANGEGAVPVREVVLPSMVNVMVGNTALKEGNTPAETALRGNSPAEIVLKKGEPN